MSRRPLALACFLLILPAAALACLWDSDTLQMERYRFPGALEIITGKFVRHSQAYYEWRIGDRKKKLETKPDDPALLDDLAVAYAKLGRPEEGIALLEPTLKTRPDRYETLSNLGTLLFFAGRLDESKRYIRRALEINPNAHFGREKYQLLLTEYVQQSEREKLGVLSNSHKYASEGGESPVGFAEFVLHSKFGPKVSEDYGHRKEQFAEIQAATTGVLGMMHFADHESLILLEVLGDLLVAGGSERDAAQHAARAYLRAAQLANDNSVADRFRKMTEESHVGYMSSPSQARTVIESQLTSDVKAAEEWFAAIEANEKRWIAAGDDVDRKFAAMYYESLDKVIAAAREESQPDPPATFTEEERRAYANGPDNSNEVRRLFVAYFLSPLVGFAVAISGGYWLYRRRCRQSHTTGAAPEAK